MKLCDTCIYRNNVEQLKPCIIYRDDCEYYKKEKDDMKAIIQIDVPDYQIGQEVRCYFKDSMYIKGVCEAERTGHWTRHTRVEDVYDIAGVKTWGIKCQCDRCGFTTIVVEDFGYYKYCPNCGAKMESEVEV